MTIKASLLIVRPPYLTTQLHPFKDLYYKYNRQLYQAISSKFFVDFYYQPQSLNSKKFMQSEYVKQIDNWGYSHYSNQDVTIDSGVDVTLNNPATNNEPNNIERLGDRSLTLLSSDNTLPTTTIHPNESLDEAALRGAYQEFGRDIDLWLVSKLPIAVNTDESGVDVGL